MFDGHPRAARRRHGADARHRRRASPRRSALAEQGFRALFLPARVPARPYNDADYDRVLGGGRGPRAAAHVPLGHRPRAARRARPGRRGHQLPPGRAARRADGDAHAGRRRRARPLPRPAGRHRRDRRRVAGVDHDPGRRDLRATTAMYAPPEAVAEAERADPAAVPRPRSCTTRSRSTTVTITGHRDAHVGQRLPAPRRHVARVAGGRRRPVRRRLRRRRARDRRRQRRRVFGFSV